MKRRLIPIACLLAFVGVAVFFLGPWRGERFTDNAGVPDPVPVPSSPQPGPAPAPEPSDLVKRQLEPPPEPTILPDMVELAEQLNDADATVQDDLEVVNELLAAYQRYLKTKPEGGENYEIMNCIRGDNRMKLIFIAAGHAKINPKGELLDRFGSPYYFHQGEEGLEIRSKGPDQKLWTDDDVAYN